jgi:hypothetical protein
VIGAVMDFADDVHQGAGKLHIININGETDPTLLENVSALIAKSKAKPVVAKVVKKAEPHGKPAAGESAHAKPEAHDDHATPAEQAPAHH